MKFKKKNKETGVWEDQAAIIDISRDGYISIAHRSKVLNGLISGIRDNKQGVAFCKVYRKDMQFPFYFEAYFEDFCDWNNPKWWNRDKGCRGSAWRIMLVKCAEHNCLRRAFSIHGVYSAEELGAINDEPTEYLQDTDIPEIEMRDTALLESAGGRPADAAPATTAPAPAAAPDPTPAPKDNCYCGHPKHDGVCPYTLKSGRQCPCQQYIPVDVWDDHIRTHGDPALRTECPACQAKLAAKQAKPAAAPAATAPGGTVAAPSAAKPPADKPKAAPSPSSEKGPEGEVIRVPVEPDAYAGRDWKINGAYIGDLLQMINEVIKSKGRHICNEKLEPYHVRIANLYEITEESAIALFKKAKMKYIPLPKTPGSTTPAAEPPATPKSGLGGAVRAKLLISKLKDYSTKVNPDAGPAEMSVHQLLLVRDAVGVDLEDIAGVADMTEENIAKIESLLDQKLAGMFTK
jgi:hypothetical protein